MRLPPSYAGRQLPGCCGRIPEEHRKAKRKELGFAQQKFCELLTLEDRQIGAQRPCEFETQLRGEPFCNLSPQVKAYLENVSEAAMKNCPRRNL